MDMTKVQSPMHQGNAMESLPGMLMNFMVYACQELRFKRLLDVKGLSICSRGEAWTCRLDSRPGVYGIIPLETSTQGDLHQVRFALYYFPGPDEEILEHSLLAAALAAQAPEYLEKVRDFPTIPNFAARFPAGELFLSLDEHQTHLGLGLRSQKQRVTISKDGILHPSEQGYVVQPGEPEETFPELEVAEAMFKTLAAAISFTMQNAPENTFMSQTPASMRIYDNAGTITEAPNKDNAHVTRYIAWGDVGAKDACAHLNNLEHDTEERTDLFWKTHDMAALEEAGEHAKAFDMRPQFIILSGFLGSGKTTFLNQLIEYYTARNEAVAVIQNEIGQTGLDGKILDGGVNAVELDEGCVCCTLAGQLGRGVQEIIKVYRPAVIVLECTGLANPMNIIKDMGELQSMVRLDSVTTLLDGMDAENLLASYEIVRDQVKAADVVVINKCDLISPEDAARLGDMVQNLNRRAIITSAKYGRIPFAALYNDTPRAPGGGLMPAVPTAHSDHRTLGFSSVQITFRADLDREKLEQSLKACPPDIFRIKGIIRLQSTDDPMVVQYVGGRWEISRFAGVLETPPFLIAIGKNMEQHDITRYLQQCQTAGTTGENQP